jgi:adenine-specific DNA-methyltransferase
LTRKLKTVWLDRAYDAGTHGTELLRKLLGEPGLFPFPKSVYAVKDCLAAVVGNRPNALIVDFFAGSGTTFHATCLLNLEDGGNRKSILVTNNEVSMETASRLQKENLYRGDPEFEKYGIFQRVTRPRCEAVITGRRADGTPIEGNHLDKKGRSRGHPFSAGFEENVEFYALEYLDPDDIELGRRLEALIPSLWLASGGVGDRQIRVKDTDFSIPEKSTYGILLKESRFRMFKEALLKRPDVTHVWLVTDSEEAFAEMRSALPKEVNTSMLYRDYLGSFKTNAGRL